MNEYNKTETDSDTENKPALTSGEKEVGKGTTSVGRGAQTTIYFELLCCTPKTKIRNILK